MNPLPTGRHLRIPIQDPQEDTVPYLLDVSYRIAQYQAALTQTLAQLQSGQEMDASELFKSWEDEEEDEEE